MAKEKEYLLLKWGTLKGWDFKRKETQDLMKEYLEIGSSFGAMQQRDTPRQKEIICQLIDKVDGPIENDWTGKKMTRNAAKQYVMEYGK